MQNYFSWSHAVRYWTAACVPNENRSELEEHTIEVFSYRVHFRKAWNNSYYLGRNSI